MAILRTMLGFSHFVDCLRFRAREQGERTAFIFLHEGGPERTEWTYRRLDEEARSLAVHLMARGEPGDRVLLLHPPGPEFIAAFFGCLYAGRVAVPVPLPASPRQLSSVLPVCEDAHPSTVLSTEGLSMLLQEPLRTRLGPQVAWLNQETLDSQASAWKPPALHPDSLAFLQYTSGSTGARRGVRVGHEQLLHNSEVIQRAFGHTPESRGVVWLPHFHDMGLIGGILQPIYCGFPVLLLSPLTFIQQPLVWLRAISDFRATTSGGPNFAYELVCDRVTEEQRTGLDLSSWDVAFTGAEPVRARTIERFTTLFQPRGFRRSAFLPCYGLAEATLFVTGKVRHKPPSIEYVDAEALKDHHALARSLNDPTARPLVGCGSPGLETRVEIVNPETRVPCPSGTVGELWVSGPSVAQGYWDRPEETPQTFQAHLADGTPGTFLRTGDLGFTLAGELFITGRQRELIILQGRNHYPQDIEATAAAASPQLRAHGAIAFSVERDTGEVLVIVQELRRGATEPQQALAALLRAVAEEHGVEPWAVDLVPPGSLPRTSSGKLQRTACRARYLEGTGSAVVSWRCGPPPSSVASASGPGTEPSAPSAGVIEQWIRERMARRLGKPLESISAREPFMSQGLGSVSAVGLAGELQVWLGRPLPPTLLYEYPTPETLARSLAHGEPGSGTAPPRGPRAASREPIALVGMGCRFPGASGPEAFWRLLHEGRDAVRPGTFPRSGEIRDERSWPGGYLDDVEGFDAGFFGISPREALSMDPQHRLLLEVGWEALEHAAQSIEALRGSSTGVFIGLSGNEYALLQATRRRKTSPYLATGSALSIAAARLSYFFDLRGPSLALDTACSSSLVAIHEACESLRRGECELALAGGVNLMLSPRLTTSFLLAGMLSPEGQCKTFDAEAHGYVRGEGCGLVVLKRLTEALAAGDRVIAVLRGSAINQDGHSNGLTAPNGQAQEAVIRQALVDAGVEPSSIGYLEAHGTGTSLGDPIEARAFTQVLGEGRSPAQRCWVGSVKTNIGHLEAAAGVAGLIKTALALEHEEVPRHLHLTRLNPHVPFEGTPFAVATSAQPWPRGAARRLASVSAFGFGGTNAHVILEEAPPRPPPRERPERLLHLLTLSAREESVLRTRMERFAQRLSEPDAPSLPDLAASANRCGPHLEHRVALVAASSSDAVRQLHRLSTRALPPRVDTRPYVVWRCGDPGAIGVGTGHALREGLPVFGDLLARCDALLRPALGWSILEALEVGSAERGAIDGPRAGPVSVVLQLALIDVWKAWGLPPDAVAARGWGECAAGYAAGVLGLEECLALVATRARTGDDVACRESLQRAWRRVEHSAARPRWLLEARGDPAHAGLGEAPPGPEAREAPRPWVIVDLMPGVEPVLPTVAVPADRAHVQVTSLAPGRPEWETLLESLAALYLHGARVDWVRFDEAWERRRVPLPPHPFQRRRYWVDPEPSESPESSADGSPHPLLGPSLGIAGARELRFERLFELEEPLPLSEHVVGGQSLLPAAAFCEMALAAGQQAFQEPVVLRGLHLSRPLSLEPGARRRVQAVVTLSGEREARFQLLSAPAAQSPLLAEWTVHGSAELGPAAPASSEPPPSMQGGTPVELDGLYRDLEGRGLHYGPTFRTLRGLTVRGSTLVGHVQRVAESQEPGWLLHPTLLDGCFQALSAWPGAAKDPTAYLPVSIESLRLLRPGLSALSCVATLREAGAEDGSLTFDLELVHEGAWVAQVRGLRLVPRRIHPDWLYRIDWRPQASRVQPETPFELEGLEPECEELLRPTAELEHYARSLSMLETLSTGYAARALTQLGRPLTPGDVFAEEGLAVRLGVVEAHHRLFHRLLRLLEEDGVLRRQEGRWQVLREPPPTPDAQALRDARQRAPDAQEELTLLERCGGLLGELLQGRREPLEVLMPGGELAPLTRLYQDSPGPRVLNQLIRRVLEVASRQASASRPLRVLEVGGGTGGTTSHVLTGLDAQRTTYLFTDVSPQMLRYARGRFGDPPLLRYQTLDLERPPEEQGLAEETFDVVIAANVLHAVSHVRQALEHLRRRLAPGGLLVLLEGVEPLRWLDLTFGVTEGWWRFEDVDLRPEHALLSVERWQTLLSECGFARGHVLRPRLDSAPRQAVIVSQLPGVLLARDVSEAPWLLLEDEGGVGRALAQRLEARGRRVVRVTPPGPGPLEGHETEAPGEGAAYRRLLGNEDWEGVVLLSGLDAPGASRSPAEALPQTTARACQVTLGALQGLVQMGRRPRAGVWIVTRDAVGGRDAEAVEGLAQAPLWGLGRTVCLEQPRLRCHLVDLQEGSIERQADGLAAELLGDGGEDQLMLREGERFVARLVRAPPLALARERLSAEGTYLVTGAFGGLGRRVSRWLVELGARALVLLGRGEPSAQALVEVEGLRRAGASVAVARADVADLPRLREALSAARGDLPPLRGVIHCAGLLEDEALERMSWARFERVLAPKVQGAWNLHWLTRESRLELFVLFSSAASLLGSPGQANHAAANAFLDALAHYRRGLGLAAQSINWGPWSEVGAAALAVRGGRLSQYGIEGIAPSEGRSLFEALLRGGGVQVGVLPIDWERWRHFPAGAARPLVEDLLHAPPAPPAPPVTPAPSDRPTSLPAAGPERLAFIEDYLVQRVRRALEAGEQPLDVHAPLSELGLDSISAIELEHDIETRFGLQLPLTSLLEGMDLAGLALAVEARLPDRVTPKADEGHPAPDEAEEAARLLEQLDELTDAQVEALLASHSDPGRTSS